MIWKDITAKTLEGFINVFNKTFRHFTSNLDETNLKLSQIEIKNEIFEPEAKNGKVIIYKDSTGFKYKNPDGTTGTFTTTPDP